MPYFVGKLQQRFLKRRFLFLWAFFSRDAFLKGDIYFLFFGLFLSTASFLKGQLIIPVSSQK